QIERLLAGGELQAVTGAAADGEQWLSKAHRTLTTAEAAADNDPDSAFTLAYDAARFACTALLAQQGLRATTRGGHYAIEVAVRSQFDGTFDQFGGLRRQRNEIEYPMIVAAQLTSADARSAAALATELIEAAEQLWQHLGLFG
ncbi:MAG: HEPN domain-containing protein, partial [Streptosporangiaceae bacterium]